MADYDTSVRVKVVTDNSSLDDTEQGIKDIGAEIDKVKKKAEEPTGALWNEKEQKAAKENIDAIIRRLEKKKELEQQGTAAGELPDSQREGAFDWEQNAQDTARISAEMEEISAKLERSGSAAQEADKHMNQLRIDVEEYAKSLIELENAGQYYGDSDYDKVYIAWKNAKDAVNEYKKSLEELTANGIAEKEERLTKEKEKQEALAAKEETRKQKEQEKLEKIAAKERERAAEEQRLQSIRLSAEVSNQNLVDLLEEQTKLEARKAELKKAGVTDGYREYDAINARLSQIKQEVDNQKNGFQKLGESAKKSFHKINLGAKKSGSLLKTFSSRLKGILLSLFVFNWISKGFNAMISGMKEGFNNLVKYSDKYNLAMSQLKSSGTQLKNSLATAFSPIVTMAIPYLVQLISYITSAVNAVAKFMAVMSGASTWTKAVAVQEDYASSLNGTASAAKKAAGALASFDTLEVLNKQDSSEAGGKAPKPEDMFEEVPVDNTTVTAFEALKQSAKELKDLFAEGFADGLGDFDTQFEDICENLTSIKDSLIEIFTDEEVVNAAKTALGKIAVAAGQTAGSFISIGMTIAQNLTGGVSRYLEENSEYLKEKLINLFDIAGDVESMIGEACAAFANIFSAFGEENGQQATANLIGIFVNAFLGIIELIGNFAKDILNVITKPFIDNQDAFKTALDGLLGVAATVLGTFKDAVDDTFKKVGEVYQAHFKPFFDSVAQGLSDLQAHFLELWNGIMQPILDKWAAKFDEVWKGSIQPMIDNFLELLGQVADVLKLLWEEVLKPFIDWLMDNVWTVVIEIIDSIANVFFAFVGGVADEVNKIIDVISGIIDFLIGVFTGDWERAWNGALKIFSVFEDKIKGIVNGILETVETLANGVVDGINMVIRAMNRLSFDIPDWVPEYGGKSFGFNIQELERVKLPRLANGAVIRGGNPFAAILGDQPLGQTNVETPVSTIEDAVARGMERYSGSRNMTINLNYDGETFARLSLNDILAEMDREGYDIDILGGTT